jgi:hypothetical protein
VVARVRGHVGLTSPSSLPYLLEEHATRRGSTQTRRLVVGRLACAAGRATLCAEADSRDEKRLGALVSEKNSPLLPKMPKGKPIQSGQIV